MENEYKILNQISPEIKNPYQVEDGYFDGLAANILLKVASKKSIYKLPDGYFESFPSKVLSKINKNEIAEELDGIAPFLSTLKKENPYKVPADYFSDSIMKEVTPAKVISIRKTSQKWLKYAVAAVFAGVLVTGGMQLYSKKDIGKVDIQASIQSLPETELLKGIAAEKVSFVYADDLNNLPQQDFNNLQDEIQSVSDEEIEVYLKENNISNEDTSSPNS